MRAHLGPGCRGPLNLHHHFTELETEAQQAEVTSLDLPRWGWPRNQSTRLRGWALGRLMMEAPKGERVWNIPGRPLVYVYNFGRASLPAPHPPPGLRQHPKFKKHRQTHMGLRSPCLLLHLEKSLIGYTCGHWGEGWPIFSPLFFWGVNGNTR